MSAKNREVSPNFSDEDQYIWPEITLDALKKAYNNYNLTTEDFEKLENPLLHALKEISGSMKVVCTKCNDLVSVTKNGKLKETYQFHCTKGGHGRSATQIISSLPDDWLLELTQDLDTKYRAELLKWAEKGSLWGELWQMKPSRNAMKRFAQELSPIKTDSLKIRAVNNGLEETIRVLKEENNQLCEENENLREELRELKNMMKSMTEELVNIKKHLLEPESRRISDNVPTEPERPSFATVTAVHRPPQKLNIRRPIQVVTGERAERNIGNKPMYSPLKLIYFKGCKRAGPTEYRRMFREIGIDTRTIRDILFLTDDIMQLTVYEASIAAIEEKLLCLSNSIERITDFNPMTGTSYCSDGSISDETAKNAYMALMKLSAERMEGLSETVKPLKRTASFLKKIVETGNLNYQSPERKPRMFFLGQFITIPSPPVMDATTDKTADMAIDTAADTTADKEMKNSNPNDQN